MKISIIYPEKLPSKKARAVSVVNTACALSKYYDTTLFYEKSNIDFLNFYALSCPLKTEEVNKRFIIRSNKIFNFNLLNKLKNKRFNVIYVRHLKTAYYLLKKGLDIIFECHEIFSYSNKSLKEMEKYVYENSSKLVFINETLQKEFNKHFNIASIPQKVVHNGCGFELPYIKKDFSKIDEIYYIGSFQKWKGVDFLIKAMRFFPELKLKIIGDGNREELEKIIRQYNLKNIEFLGFKKQNEVKEILKTSKLCVIPNIPTHFNKFSSPIKLYEYMMSSNIVLSADMDTVKEILTDEENGFLFKSGDEKDFVEKLKMILSLDSQRLSEISKNAYKTGSQFTWDNRAKQLIEFFKE